VRLRVILVIGLDDRSMRQGGVDINRHVEFSGPLPDWPKTPVIVKDAVCHAVDHGTFEAELHDGALQLVRCGPRVGGRQHGEGGETVRMALHRLV
jgi:hypothetical protein